MNDQAIEKEIQAKGLTAPRITPADIEANIAQEIYLAPADALRFAYLTSDPADKDERAQKNSIIESLPTRTYSGACLDIDANTEIPDPLKLITVCVLILRNGHRIVGINEGPVSVGNFDVELGRKLARQKAIDQIWPLMGYELKQRLAAEISSCNAVHDEPTL
jgi:hypothetical protein